MPGMPVTPATALTGKSRRLSKTRVHHEGQVGVKVPVQGHADAVHDAALDASGPDTVVEVDIRVTTGNFPGAPAPAQAAGLIADGESVLVRPLSAEVIPGQAATFLVVRPVLARQRVGKLDVSAVEHVVRGDTRALLGRRIVQKVPAVLGIGATTVREYTTVRCPR